MRDAARRGSTRKARPFGKAGARNPVRAGAAALAVAAVVLWTAVVGGQPGQEPETQSIPLGLRWNAPAQCSSEQAVRSEVESLLHGGKPATRTPVQASVTIRTPSAGLAIVHITTLRGGVTGERTLRAASCESGAHAAALILAIAIDPAQVAANQTVGTRALGPASAQVPATASAAPSVAPRASAPAPPQPPPAPRPSAAVLASEPKAPAVPDVTRWNGGASVLMDVGTLPEPSLGASVHLERRLQRYSVELQGQYFPQVQEQSPVESSSGGKLDLFSVGARGAWLYQTGRALWAPGAGLELGAMRGVGYGVSVPTSVWGLWMAASFGGYVALPLREQWALRIDSYAVVPLRRDRFVLDQLGVIHQSSVVAGRFAIGIDVAF